MYRQSARSRSRGVGRHPVQPGISARPSAPRRAAAGRQAHGLDPVARLAHHEQVRHATQDGTGIREQHGWSSASSTRIRRAQGDARMTHKISS